MFWRQFTQSIREESFFTQLDEAIGHAETPSTLPHWQWLRLIKTDRILTWLRESLDAPLDYLPAISTVLERQTLNLENRLDPHPIKDYWQWVLERFGCSSSHAMLDWDAMPATLENDTIFEQEEEFARLLLQMGDRLDLVGQLDWVAKLFRDIAYRHGIAGRPSATNAHVQVAFALEEFSTELRPGALIDFRLSANQSALVWRQELFDRQFNSVLDQVRFIVGRDKWFSLMHNWDLPIVDDATDAIFHGGSGALAIMVAQRLAQGGGRLGGERWCLPPWVVVSAGHDAMGASSHGSATAPELVEQKANLLIEEGIRVLLVPLKCAGQIPADSRLETFVIETPESLVGETSCQDFIEHLQDRNLLWRLSSDFAKADSSLFPGHPGPDESHHFFDLQAAQLFDFDYEQEFLRPTHFDDELRNAMTDLPASKGYVLVLADRGMGKTVWIRSPQWPSDFGNVLWYSIVKGRLESPWDFLNRVRHQSEALDVTPLPAINVRTDQRDDLRRTLAELLHAIKGARRHRNKPLVLAIDGIDQIGDAAWLPFTILDILPPAELLPDDCYIVLTAQGPAPKPMVTEQLSHLTSCGQNLRVKSVRKDNQEYTSLLQRHLLETTPQRWHAHIDEIINAAGSEFLYVSLYAQLAREAEGEPTPSKLPMRDEVWGVYLDKLERQVNEAIDDEEDRFTQWHRPFLGLLAVAGAVPLEYVWSWLRLSDGKPTVREQEHQFRMACQELRRLTSAMRVETLPAPLDEIVQESIGAEEMVFIFHDELRTWLLENQTESWESVKLEAQRRIVQAASARVGDGRFAPDEAGIDAFHRMFVPTYLLELGEREAAREWALEHSWTDRALWAEGEHHRRGTLPLFHATMTMTLDQLKRLVGERDFQTLCREDPTLALRLAESSFTLSLTSKHGGQLKEARSSGRDAMELLERLREIDPHWDEKLELKLITCRSHLADLEFTQGSHTQGMILTKAGLQEFRKLRSRPNVDRTTWAVAAVHAGMLQKAAASSLAENGDYQEARAAYRSAIKEVQGAIDEHKTGALTVLVHAHGGLGDLAARHQDVQGALKAYDQSAKAMEQFVESVGSIRQLCSADPITVIDSCWWHWYLGKGKIDSGAFEEAHLVLSRMKKLSDACDMQDAVSPRTLSRVSLSVVALWRKNERMAGTLFEEAVNELARGHAIFPKAADVRDAVSKLLRYSGIEHSYGLANSAAKLRLIALGRLYAPADYERLVPRLMEVSRRNDPCPCGSGKKLKHCHS